MLKGQKSDVSSFLDLLAFILFFFFIFFSNSQTCSSYYCVSCCGPHFSAHHLLSPLHSLMQSAHLRFRRTVCQRMSSAWFRTPRLLLGHPGSLTPVHDLKCMRAQTAPLFNAPRGRLGNRAQVPFPRIYPVTWTGVEPTTLGL